MKLLLCTWVESYIAVVTITVQMHYPKLEDVVISVMSLSFGL